LLEIVSPQHKSSEYQHERRGQGSGSIDWDAESSLEFLQKYSDRKGRNPLRNESEMTVLLTGATGFLGRFVLLSLLQSTTVEKVYCTVKSESNIVPSKRVADILSQLCNELSLDNTFQNKLEVMEGDLTLERLGLTEPNYTALCSHVDVVIHNGAVVNAALPYASLKGANVDGTKEVLKIVCEGRPKFLHYVSSMGVFSGQSSEEMITEDTLPNKERLSRLSGYSQSKWVGETIVLKAMKQKLIQASVSRPGLIGAHSSTGHANLQDWLCWLVRGLARLGSCPVGPGCDDRVFYCVPVDQVAKAIVFFSLTYQGETYNVLTVCFIW
jgi:thioester reductase-like protein